MKHFIVVVFGLFWAASFAQSALEPCALGGTWQAPASSFALMFQQQLDPDETLWFSGVVDNVTLELTELERDGASVTLAARYEAPNLDYEYGLTSEPVMRQEDIVHIFLDGERSGYLFTFHADGTLDIAFTPTLDDVDTLTLTTNLEGAPDVLAATELFSAANLSGTYFCPDENALNLFPSLTEQKFAGSDIGQLPFRRAE